MLLNRIAPLTLALSISLLWQTTALGTQPETQRQLTAGVELFHWQEFDPGSPLRLLSEQGMRLALQANWNNVAPANRIGTINVKTRVYSGALNYDGQTQSLLDPTKNGIFVASTSRYNGLDAELESLSPLHGHKDAALLLSLGIDIWRRNIQQSIDAQGNSIEVAVEDYRVLYSRLGLQWQKHGIFGTSQTRIGVKYPLRIDERAIDVTLHPGRSLSLFAAYRLNLADNQNTIVEIYYDSLRLAQSPVVYDQYGNPWLQPESRQDSVGIMVGIPF